MKSHVSSSHTTATLITEAVTQHIRHRVYTRHRLTCKAAPGPSLSPYSHPQPWPPLSQQTASLPPKPHFCPTPARHCRSPAERPGPQIWILLLPADRGILVWIASIKHNQKGTGDVTCFHRRQRRNDCNVGLMRWSGSSNISQEECTVHAGGRRDRVQYSTVLYSTAMARFGRLCGIDLWHVVFLLRIHFPSFKT